MTKRIKCECKDPPCRCKSFQRDTACEHMLKGDYGKDLHECKKVGTLRDDCNIFWESKKVLCDEHYPEHLRYASVKCGVCGSSYANCVC